MLANPVNVYFGIWLFVVFLYSLNLSNLLTPLKSATIYLIFGSGFFLFLGWFLASLKHKNLKFFNIKLDLKSYIDVFASKSFSRRLRIAFFIWLFFTLLEIVYFGNLPLFSLFGFGPSIRYTEFGIPGIHGFINALYFSVLLLYFIQFLIIRSFKNYFIFFLLVLWPFLVIHRMMFIAFFIQAFFVYYLLRDGQLKLKNLFILFIVSISVIFIFGYIGDLRSGREHILRLAGFTTEYPDWLPTGFAWIYLYIVTPVNNINFNINNFTEISPFPFETFLRIFPSFVRDVLVDNFVQETSFQLYKNAFNVSTLFLILIKDFGYIATPFLFFFIGYINYLMCLKSMRDPAYIFFRIVFLYALVISVFSNHMFHLVFIFQGLIGFIIVKGVKC